MKITKTCENCQDKMVCIAYGKETTKACKDWQISLEEYTKQFGRKKEETLH